LSLVYFVEKVKLISKINTYIEREQVNYTEDVFLNYRILHFRLQNLKYSKQIIITHYLSHHNINKNEQDPIQILVVRDYTILSTK